MGGGGLGGFDFPGAMGTGGGSEVADPETAYASQLSQLDVSLALELH